MSDINVDEIEALLQQLENQELGAPSPTQGGTTRVNTSSSAKTNMSDTDHILERHRKQLVEFSSYSAADLRMNPHLESPQLQKGVSSSPSSAMKGSSSSALSSLPNATSSLTLKPLQAGPSSSLPVAVGASPFSKEVLGGATPKRPVSRNTAREILGIQRQTSSTETQNRAHADDEQTHQKNSSPSQQWETNFLPVMYCRAIQGQELRGITPKARWGHSLTAVGDSLWMFGGSVNPSSSSLSSAVGMGLMNNTTYTTAGEQLSNDAFELSIGRSEGPISLDGAANNSTSLITPSSIATTYTWEPVFAARGQLPSPRVYHAAASYLQRFWIVYGGEGQHQPPYPTANVEDSSASIPQQRVLLGDLHVYDTIFQEWKALEGGQKYEPSGRLGHTVVVVGDYMFAVGGRIVKKSDVSPTGPQQQQQLSYSPMDSLCVFDLLSFRWKKKFYVGPPRREESSSSSKGPTEAEPVVDEHNLIPAKRAHHGACVVRGWLYIHGGEAVTGGACQFLRDTWALDLSLYHHNKHKGSPVSAKWIRIHTGVDSDNSTVPRSRFALFGCGESIFAIGGVPSSTAGSVPQLRGPPAALRTAAHQPPHQLSLCVFPIVPAVEGASDTLQNAWISVSLGGQSFLPQSKKNFGAAMLHGFVYVFGGVAEAEGSTNSLIRCLALDGVTPTSGEDSNPSKNQQQHMVSTGRLGWFSPASLTMAKLFDCKLGKDVRIVMHGGGTMFSVHRAVIAQRAPEFYDELTQCRPWTQQDPSGSVVGPPSYDIDGNSRVKGLSFSFTPTQMNIFLKYLYTGNVEYAIRSSEEHTVEEATAGDDYYEDDFEAEDGSKESKQPKAKKTVKNSNSSSSSSSFLSAVGSREIGHPPQQQQQQQPLRVEHFPFLSSVSNHYHIEHLSSITQYILQESHASGNTAPSPTSRRVQQILSISPSRQRTLDSTKKEDLSSLSRLALNSSLLSLLDSCLFSSVTVLFMDPHTGKQCAQSIHPFMVMQSSLLFKELLTPLLQGIGMNGKNAPVTMLSNTVGGVTAKANAQLLKTIFCSTSSSTTTLGANAMRRAIIIGPVKIPFPSVRPVLEYLYTQELCVSSEVAFPTMLAAHALRLPQLQAYCEAIVAREEVTCETCCDFLSLAQAHGAPMLEELSLLTAATGLENVSKTASFRSSCSAATRERIEKLAKEIRTGRFGIVTPPHTEQQTSAHYQRQFERSGAPH